MGLITDLRATDKKKLFVSNDDFVNYSTGFLPLDYANGFLMDAFNDKGEVFKSPLTGLIGGTFTTVIGYSGSGKTTLADQIGANIIKPFEDGLLMHIDSEQTALKPRMEKITGMHNDERLILNKEHVAIEDVLDIITDICKKKDAGGNLYKYEIKNPLNPFQKMKFFVPTVLIIDSLYTFNSRERDNSELEGQMSAGREVREIAQFYSKGLNNMARYNINIISVNHIKSKVDVNPYSASPPQLMLLKPGETLPRGQAPVYLAQNVFRCNAIKSNMYSIEDNGFEGMKVNVQIAKTKTAFIGSSVDLAFNSKIGFDPIYTLYEYASSIGLIQGRNPYLYLQGLDQFKFNRKDFRNKFIDDTEFRRGVYGVLQPFLDALLGSKVVTDADKERFRSLESLEEDKEGNLVKRKKCT